jgi:hypothetical protein
VAIGIATQVWPKEVVVVTLSTFLLAIASVIASTGQYATATLDETGNVVIVTESGQRITPSKDEDQVGAAQVKVSPNLRSVGWLALYPFCCTSYPLPLKLFVQNGGRLLTINSSSGSPIWFWMFQNKGTRIAVREETPHGSKGTYYVLWDVRTGRRVTDYTPKYDANGNTIARPHEPKWVQALDATERQQQ